MKDNFEFVLVLLLKAFNFPAIAFNYLLVTIFAMCNGLNALFQDMNIVDKLQLVKERNTKFNDFLWDKTVAFNGITYHTAIIFWLLIIWYLAT